MIINCIIMKKIIFCIPGNIFSNRFLRCWTDIVFWCIQNNYHPILSNDTDSNVYFVRSKILGGSSNVDFYNGDDVIPVLLLLPSFSSLFCAIFLGL